MRLGRSNRGTTEVAFAAQDTLSALNNGQVDELIISAAKKRFGANNKTQKNLQLGKGNNPPFWPILW